MFLCFGYFNYDARRLSLLCMFYIVYVVICFGNSILPYKNVLIEHMYVHGIVCLVHRVSFCFGKKKKKRIILIHFLLLCPLNNNMIHGEVRQRPMMTVPMSLITAGK